MRKKWTYAAIFGMMLGMAPVFTGCIDTDEPAGLEDLRVAKAELLRAKAAVEAARVAEVEANAALIQAQAKTEEARARNEAAQAAINEARAKQEEAVAILKELDNEQKRAEIEELLRQYQRDQLEWEAEMAQAQQEAANAQAEWELYYKKLELTYQQALIDLSLAQVTLTSEQNKVLDGYILAYQNAQKAYREASQKVTDAIREYNKAVAAAEEDKDFVKRQLDWNIKQAEAAKAGADEALKYAQDELAEAKELATSDFANKQAQLEAEIHDLNSKILQLQVQSAEKVRSIYETDGAQAMALDQSYQDYLEIEKTSQAIEIQLPGNIFPWATYNMPAIEIEERTYTNNDINQYAVTNGYASNEYAEALGTLKYYIDMFKSWERDDNDAEWTNETISRLNYEAKQLDAEIQVKKDELQDALEAFNIGDYPNVDPTKFFGYDILDKAVASFNAQIKKYNDAALAIKASNDALDPVDGSIAKAYKKAVDDAQSEKDQAYADAKTAYETGVEAVTSGARLEQAQKEMTDLLTVLANIDEALKKDPDNAALKAQKEENLKSQNEVSKLISDLQDGTELGRIEDARNTAEDLADAAFNKAVIAADKIKQDAEKAENDKIKANSDIQTAAMTQLTTVELPATKKAFGTYEESATKADLPYAGTVLSFAASQIDDALVLSADKNGVMVLTSLDLKAMTKLDRDALLGLIIARANYLYGGASGTNEYGDLNTQVLGMNTKALKEKVQKEAAEAKLIGWDYFNAYDAYGALGRQAKCEELAAMAGKWLTNGDELKKLIEPLQTAYDAMQKDQEAVAAEVESREQAISDKWAEVQELLQTAYEPVSVEQAKLRPILQVLQQVNNALSSVVSNSSDGVWSTSDIEFYISKCEEVVKKFEKEQYDAETAVMQANQARNDWNSGAKNYVTLCAEALEDARTALSGAEEDLAAARTRLQAIIDSLSMGGDTTTGEEVTE